MLSENASCANDVFSFANLYRQYIVCRKNKRGTMNALKFEVDAEALLWQLSYELQSRKYQPSRVICFAVAKPKKREIIAADFRDRVVHHVLIHRLEALFEPGFIYDSFACRKNKGVYAAIHRLEQFIKSLSGKNSPIYYLQLDIKSFFLSINKNILYQILAKKVADPRLLWLARLIIFQDLQKHYILKGDLRLHASIPAHKSLLCAPSDQGLPIGNLTSQFFANVYLNELDQYVKHALKCKYYLRYCDDFMILDTDFDQLCRVKESIQQFLALKLQLALNERYGEILSVQEGIDFLGYIVRPHYKLVRARVLGNFTSKLHTFFTALIQDGKEGARAYQFNYDLLAQLRSVLASYFGHINKADSYHLKQALLSKHCWLHAYFDINPNLLLGGAVKFIPRFKHPKAWPNIYSQYGYYVHTYPCCVILFQVGCYYEFYHELPAGVRVCLNLKPLAQHKRKALYSFRCRQEAQYKTRLLAAGYNVVVVRETGQYFIDIKERLPTMMILTKEEKFRYEQRL